MEYSMKHVDHSRFVPFNLIVLSICPFAKCGCRPISKRLALMFSECDASLLGRLHFNFPSPNYCVRH